MNEVQNRLNQLRQLMKDNNVDIYIVTSSDSHQTEYVSSYFKCREYISGFTGSAGTVVILQDSAYLWCDGRYFTQAELQLKDSGIELCRMSESGVPTITEFLIDKCPNKGVIGFDGRTVTVEDGIEYAQALQHLGITINYDLDLVGSIWHDRGTLSLEPAYLLDIKYAGESFASKLARVRTYMKQVNATQHILASLDDIAWLFNIRGNDIQYSQLVFAYAIIGIDSLSLFMDEDKLNDSIRDTLTKENCKIFAYHDVYQHVSSMASCESVLLDPSKVNFAMYNSLVDGITKIELANPTILFKAIKNDIEIANIRNSHLKDGIAFTKFMHWVKTSIHEQEITELSASEKLYEFRCQQEGFLGASFAPIVAYRANAAMMHYEATESSFARLEASDMLLVDTGGHYYDGTTDITRTLALGELNKDLKQQYTAVLRGMINLSMAKFLYGVKGYNLDILARQPIWQLDLDYKCGTGHGVGFLLNIHEGPAGFRWNIVPSKNETATLEAGMLLTNEPGIYIEGSHGIRIENELIIQNETKNEYGQFMSFETVTLAPIDLDAIDASLMTKAEIDFLNRYHQTVYDKLSVWMDETQKAWLKEYTRNI